ncbi:MAG: energy transducer TonB [Flavobacteriales bacterium]|nr:energy transducer TonB [Flavobacteriales bacterium]
MKTNIKYPEVAKENDIEGTVYLRFIVEKDGSLSNITVLRGVKGCLALEQEAIRAMKISPLWTPGKQSGEVVRTSWTLPVKFSLPN